MILLGPISPLSPKSPWALALEAYWVLLSIESYFPTDTLETQGSIEPLVFVVNGAPGVRGALGPGLLSFLGPRSPIGSTSSRSAWVGEVLQVGGVPRI